MSIFISYSHNDADIVEDIALNLVKYDINVWIDKWELNYGDSLLDNIQSALTDCSALLIMLSKSSVESEWCKKEINAGLMRELEEKQVLVIPVLLDDCKIPLFLKDKLYADFRGEFYKAIKKLSDHLAKVNDITMRRVQIDNNFIDWALDDGLTNDNKLIINIDSLSIGKERDYSILCVLVLHANKSDSISYMTASNREDIINNVIRDIFNQIKVKEKVKVLLPDSFPKRFKIVLPKDHLVDVYIRRMGNNNAFDVLFDYGSILYCIEQVRGIS